MYLGEFGVSLLIHIKINFVLNLEIDEWIIGLSEKSWMIANAREYEDSGRFGLADDGFGFVRFREFFGELS